MPRHTRQDDLAPHQNGARRRAARAARKLDRLRKLDAIDGGQRVSRKGHASATQTGQALRTQIANVDRLFPVSILSDPDVQAYLAKHERGES